jgi:hypothetical protein
MDYVFCQFIERFSQISQITRIKSADKCFVLPDHGLKLEISRPDRSENPLRFFSGEIEADSGNSENRKHRASSPPKKSEFAHAQILKQVQDDQRSELINN